jgi:hypothetical protein
VALVIFYAFFGCVVATREQQWPLANYFQAWSLHWAMLGIVVAMALFGSLVLTAVSSNLTITFIATIAILLVGRYLHKVALSMTEPSATLITGLYYVIPHLELFDVRDLIVQDWPLVPWGIWLLALAYAAAYTVLLLLLSWLVFRKKVLQ